MEGDSGADTLSLAPQSEITRTVTTSSQDISLSVIDKGRARKDCFKYQLFAVLDFDESTGIYMAHVLKKRRPVRGSDEVADSWWYTIDENFATKQNDFKTLQHFLQKPQMLFYKRV